jgi:hypothetical protein
MNDKVKIGIIISSVVIAIIMIYLIMDLNTANTKIEDLTTNLQDANIKLNNANSRIVDLNANYTQLKVESNNLLTDVQKYKNEMQESLAWYKANAIINQSDELSRTRREIDRSCYDVKGDTCSIKLGCFYLINSEFLNLKYKSDEKVYDQDDHIGSIIDFIDSKGGDCEDYSLFFKAEYNYAVSQCEGKNIILEGWENKYDKTLGREDDLDLDFVNGWYMPDVTAVNIEGYIYPNIICGDLAITDGNVSGHCMIALSNVEIKTISDIPLLIGAYIIEPQDGSFYGNIKESIPRSSYYQLQPIHLIGYYENQDVYLQNRNWSEYNENDMLVASVITDNDFFLYSNDDLEWKSTYDYKELLIQEESKLLAILS